MKDNRYLNADDKLMLELIEKIEDAGLRTKLHTPAKLSHSIRI